MFILDLKVLASSCKKRKMRKKISQQLKSRIEKSYTLSKFVNKGCEGKVFKAIRKCDKKTVAVKFVTRARNLAEILNNVKLRTNGVRNVNRMLDYKIDDDETQFALVLDYMPKDLFHYITEYEPTENVCKIIMRQIILAVTDISKRAGLVHLDLKEENILIDPETLKIQICDFSSCMDASCLVETITSKYAITEYFLSPETVKDDKFYPTRSIVWIMGLICFNLLNACDDRWKKYKGQKIEKCLKFKDNISQEARDFVYKCCTVDVRIRPDVKHLLDLPWMRN